MIFFDNKRIHFIGIGGIGMSAIAEQLFVMGIDVQGANNVENDNTRRLQQKGIKVFIGQDDPSVLDGVDVVVVSSAIRSDNAELQEAKRRGLPIGHRAEMLAQLMRYKQGIAVAGTHGKTTTSAMISHVLMQSGMEPSCIVGGVMNNYGTNSILGSSDWIVVEADESDGSFLYLDKQIAVVTNMDPEHLDYYKSAERMNDAYLHFMNTTDFYGCCVVCTDHPVVRQCAAKVLNRKIISYGMNEDASIRAVNVRFEGGRLHFDVQKGSGIYKDFELAMFGEHNVLNALAAFAVASEMGVSAEQIRQALSDFSGVQRRFTLCGRYKGVPIYDDYAHHPEEIKATLKAAKLAVKNGKVIAVFQPHRYSRFGNLMDDFTHAFDDADLLFVMDVYSAGEQPVLGISKEVFLSKMSHKSNVYALNDETSFINQLKQCVNEGDLIIGLGAGDISKLMHQLESLLSKQEDTICGSL